MNDQRIVTQWGSAARPFSSYSPEERQHLLCGAAALIDRINDELGITCFISYGALLGAVRSGALIGHDFDLDAVFMPASGRKEDVAAAVEQLVVFLQKDGFTVSSESNGQFKADRREDGRRFRVEFFAGWTEGDQFFMYFAIRGAPIADSVLPLGSVAIEDVMFRAPHVPETVVASIYGPNWRIPDPGFKYALTAADWKPFSYLFTSDNQKFWDSYYAKANENDVWVEFPSQFAVFAASVLSRGDAILEIGCGNGRDGLFLGRCGFKMTMTDYSKAAIASCQQRAESQAGTFAFQTLNVRDIAATTAFVAKHGGTFDAVYARFFVHAIDRPAAQRFLKLAAGVLKKGGLLLLEYRALDAADPDAQKKQTFANGAHYRRMVPVKELEGDAAAAGFTTRYSVEGRGMAKYKDEDPWIARNIFVAG
jgi:SAM-dependent methyltransferase